LPLLAGQYDVSVAVYDHALTHAHDHHHRMYSFLVRGAPTPAGLFDFAGTWEAD
ncbi:MAG: ABC transporter ATP-binding protein, partial [Ardenticatenales bacterium]|nr:ABC transporter ATP-binding protein [Ardenticatenales bacterium]